MPRVGFVDTYDMGLTPDGRARPELFVKDRLHFSPEGYKLLSRTRPPVPGAVEVEYDAQFLWSLPCP